LLGTKGYVVVVVVGKTNEATPFTLYSEQNIAPYPLFT
jgi:hypothetical protein